MADTLRHRGPDAGGSWADPASGIALGHRRLGSVAGLDPVGVLAEGVEGLLGGVHTVVGEEIKEGLPRPFVRVERVRVDLVRRPFGSQQGRPDLRAVPVHDDQAIAVTLWHPPMAVMAKRTVIVDHAA